MLARKIMTANFVHQAVNSIVIPLSPRCAASSTLCLKRISQENRNGLKRYDYPTLFF
jgi:hypothetical protein